MKKFLLFAAALLTFFACEKKEDNKAVDSIGLSVESKTIDNNGSSFSVMVTSSSDWTLAPEEENTWAHPDMTSGADGDIVRFTVDPNTGGEDLTAVYVFEAGKATARLTIKSLAKELDQLEVESTDVVAAYNATELTLNVKAEAAHRDITVKVSENDWLKHIVNLPGEDGFAAAVKFSLTALEGLDDRSATITLSADNAADVTVNVLQEAKHVLSTESKFYSVKVEGETIEIPVTANVEYSVAVAQEGNWLTYEKKDGAISFTATALTGDKRSATVTFTQTDAKDGEEPLVLEIKITQVSTLVSWAADLRGNRLFPKWEGTADKLGVAKAITLEAMVNVEEFHSEISTIMGIEGRFLLRFGDAGVPINKMQVATLNGNYPVDYDFQVNTWYHIACTYEMDDSYKANVKVYVNGELVGEKSDWSMSVYVGWPTFGYVNGVDFSPAWSYEPDGKRCFWMGYAYDANRDLRGKMTEIRIWNKVLTAEEINAENHFYTVDPQSEGLHSYWKFEAGSGSTVADATGKGNVLYGETNVRKQGSDNIGDAGINWVEVALPDK